MDVLIKSDIIKALSRKDDVNINIHSLTRCVHYAVFRIGAHYALQFVRPSVRPIVCLSHAGLLRTKSE